MDKRGKTRKTKSIPKARNACNRVIESSSRRSFSHVSPKTSSRAITIRSYFIELRLSITASYLSMAAIRQESIIFDLNSESLWNLLDILWAYSTVKV